MRGWCLRCGDGTKTGEDPQIEPCRSCVALRREISAMQPQDVKPGPDVIKFCAEGCERQQSGELSAWRMLEASAYAFTRQMLPSHLVILNLGLIVDPSTATSGRRRCPSPTCPSRSTPRSSQTPSVPWPARSTTTS